MRLPQLIPGDYEARHGMPGPHEPVCPRKNPDPKYSNLVNPCGRARGHEGPCNPMDCIQKARRRAQKAAERAEIVRERHARHEAYTEGCSRCTDELSYADLVRSLKGKGV
jgi:hypothetical protein